MEVGCHGGFSTQIEDPWQGVVLALGYRDQTKIIQLLEDVLEVPAYQKAVPISDQGKFYLGANRGNG